MELIVYYKNFLELCKDDVYTLFYFWEPEIIRTWRNSGIEYERTWCQEALDFAYRVIKIGFMGIDYPDGDPTQEEINYIFAQMSQNTPNNIDGFAIWSSYQLYLSDKGRDFLEACGNSQINNTFNKRLVNILDINHVGFDKHGFVPIRF
ncbi:hypothetical protein [Komagataeibacter rhaeticus]|uniref:Uncharacterized protein n=1 Tax=Komagataeibacter rhaeticus TaxID=215221 RepID=A0A858JHX3_9PROT|nr:hypothetical protein [Komagataeibacter rhaeticus]QIP36705.1 hypothetical protein GWK63_15755 [Komagataeibacter rhaeticus]QOC46468.1 hypothetical protein ICJ78_15755 [Komagataeibacter rhaeticus]WPP23192.1 hypothetical protein SCD25_06900 [Komagataeibacter rhaeticus]